MKKIYMLGFASLLSIAVLAQHSKKLTISNGDESFTKKRGVVGQSRTVSGGIVCNTPYVAGSTMDLSFTLTTTNTDLEYIDSLALTFPAGFTVNSSPSDPFPSVDTAGGAAVLNYATGQIVSWGNNVTNTTQTPANYGGIDASTGQTFIVNVTIAPGTTGAQSVDFFAKGDEYPATATTPGPNGDLSGTITLNEQLTTDAKVLKVGFVNTTSDACGLTSDNLFVAIKNLGGTTINAGDSITYTVNGGTPVTEATIGFFTVSGTPVTTASTGDTVIAVFATPIDLSTTGTTYKVIASIAFTGDADATNNTDSTSVTHFSTLAVPYSTGFETSVPLDLQGVSVFDADNSGFSFGLNSTAHSGAYSLRAYENSVNAASNDWVILSCMDFVAGTNYRVSYWKRLTSGYAGGAGVSIGSTQDVAGMTQVIEAVTPITVLSTWIHDSADFTVTSDGTYYIGFNAVNTDVTKSIALRIDDVHIFVVPTTTTGVVEMSSNNNLSVYPSPSTGVFNINVTDLNTSLEVFDIVGKRIYADTQLSKGVNSINLTAFAEGAYFVKVISGSKVATQKIIISK